MSTKRRLTCVVITFSFVLISQVSARSDQDRIRGGHAHAKPAPSDSILPPLLPTDIEAQLAALPWSAPVGHRQPRAADLHMDAELSPDGMRLRQENDAVDRKLRICRGC
jgi:hypothetical protein